MKNELTDKEYWESNYRGTDLGACLPDLDDFRDLPAKRIVETILGVGLEGKEVIEIGAGNSTYLLQLARICGEKTRFWGLDYTEAGCHALRERAKANNLDIGVIHGDMFDPSDNLKGRFDVLYSIGVVEHFSDLPSVLSSLAIFLKPGGTMVTLIPNMRGAIGYLTSRWNPRVFALHNPHDLASLQRAHTEAGLEVLKGTYLCSNNFGVLSSCFDGASGAAWRLYVFLTRVSKFLWFIENKVGDLPGSQAISPYLYTLARKCAA